MNREDCCDRLARCYAVELEQFTELYSRLECVAVSLNQLDSFWRCTRCRQVWEYQTNPFHRLGHYYVIRSIMDKHGNPRPMAYDPITDEIRLLDTNERMTVTKGSPHAGGCLSFWL